MNQKRKEKVTEQLDHMAPEKRKVCVKRKCICTGCVNAVGVKSSELKWYKESKGEAN